MLREKIDEVLFGSREYKIPYVEFVIHYLIFVDCFTDVRTPSLLLGLF